MKQKSLFLMCGVPGAGKTTWIKNQKSPSLGKSIHISRDVIRFNKLKDEEEYFSHEDEVFEEFVDAINTQILYTDVDTIFVDATHLNERSRNKTLDCLHLENVNLYAVDFDIPVEICLQQNELRRGDKRAYVPRSVIRRMDMQYERPHDGEKYHYLRILHIGGER